MTVTSLQSLLLEVESAQQHIQSILTEQGNLSEFELIQQLKQSRPDFFASLPDPERLYEQHFWVMYNLYVLREKLSQQGLHLDISPIDISISSHQTEKEELVHYSPLGEYYLNLSNILLAESEVNQLLNQFWQKYLALDQKADALRVLQLDQHSTINRTELKRQYQKLAAKHHPDKGGNESEFNAIQTAYQQLKQIF